MRDGNNGSVLENTTSKCSLEQCVSFDVDGSLIANRISVEWSASHERNDDVRTNDLMQQSRKCGGDCGRRVEC